MSNRALDDTASKPPYLRFTDEEIDGFLIFLLEGGADKRCSNVYRIIEQQRNDIREARRILRIAAELATGADNVRRVKRALEVLT